MGGGASAIDDRTLILNEVEAQKLKPADGSDVTDFDSAILEITKLRNFFHMLDIEGIRESLDRMGSGVGPEPEAEEQLSEGERRLRGQEIVSLLKTKMTQRFDSLHESFLSIDTDKSGYLSQSEFQEACWNWGILLTPADFELVNSTYAHQEQLGEPDNGINYREFIALMTNQTHYTPGGGSSKNTDNLSSIVRSKVLADVDTMREAFKKLDRDGSGTVERDEMRVMLRMYNIGCSDDDFEGLIQKYDKNGDGKFSYGEFVQLLQGQ